MATSVNRKVIRQLVLGAAIGAVLGVVLSKIGWHGPQLFARNFNHFDYDVEWNRVTPALILWVVFFAYWTVASGNSAPTKTSESKVSTSFHQIVLNAALLLLFIPVPGLTGWFLPRRFHFLVAVGAVSREAGNSRVCGECC